jgi:small subunit ribosomal protein S21
VRLLTGVEWREESRPTKGGPVIKVRPRGNESIQQMLKRFKRLCQREGLTRDMKRHSYYEKPSERKRRQARKAVRKAEKEGMEPQFPR